MAAGRVYCGAHDRMRRTNQINRHPRNPRHPREIAAASQEQSIGIEQVNQSVTQMDEVTQQNAALVEEAAAAAQSMQEQASKLAQVVSMFTLHTQRA